MRGPDPARCKWGPTSVVSRASGFTLPPVRVFLPLLPKLPAAVCCRASAHVEEIPDDGLCCQQGTISTTQAKGQQLSPEMVTGRMVQGKVEVAPCRSKLELHPVAALLLPSSLSSCPGCAHRVEPAAGSLRGEQPRGPCTGCLAGTCRV